MANLFDDEFTQEGLDDMSMEMLGAELEADDEAADVDSDEEAAEEALAGAYMLDLASESDIEELAESTEAMQEMSEMFGVAMERTIVRMDRKARLSHLGKQAELNLARQANDPIYKKLMKVWMLERKYEEQIHKKYASKAHTVAMRKIKDYAANGKRIAKPNPSTVAYKGKVSGKIAQKAVSNSKKMFSNSDKKTAGR